MKQIQISLIDTTEKKGNPNKVSDRLLTIILVILYPLVFCFGLVAVFFAALLSLYQGKLFKKDDVEHLRSDTDTSEKWSILTTQDSVKIFRNYAGEIRFGPLYLKLKSEPLIPYLTEKIFGDWFYYRDKTLYLQRWNSIENPDTDLIAINTETMEVEVLQPSIPSVLWEIVEIENGSLQLTCDTGYQVWTYSIHKI